MPIHAERAALDELNRACRPLWENQGPKALTTALLAMFAMVTENFAWQTNGIAQMELLIENWRAGRRVALTENDQAGSA